MENVDVTTNSQMNPGLTDGGTATEQVVARIWIETLRLPAVASTDDFFTIGGDSMKAMEVIARISQDLQVELPLMAFFEDPTIAHLAAIIDAMSPGPAGTKADLIKIWLEVLNIPSVAADADFFTVGGDSMKAMEVIARVNETLGVELPLMSFFEEPTIHHLATVLDELIPKASASEQALTRIWSDVLRVESITPTADFFEIGGDSMKAMEVIARVNDELHLALPLMSFFEEPTIAHLATVLDQLTAAQAPPASTTIVRVPGRTEFPLSYSQQVFWLLEQQNNKSGLYNTARVFFLHGKVDATILQRALNEVRRRHEIFQVRFVLGKDGPFQIVDPGANITLYVVDLSTLDESERDRTAQQHVLATVRDPLNLETGPPLRARLIRLNPGESILAMAIHHVVSDGFTGSILLDELRTLYDAFAAGLPSNLPEVDIHFTDYAAWERETLTHPRLEADLDYWRPVLAGAPTSVDLPADHDDPSGANREGHLRSVTLPKESLGKLQALAQSNGATLFTILNAAFRALIHRFSGQADFLVGTIASNRSRARTERMVGCFINSLPLRNPILEGQTVLDLISREKTAVMNAFAHQDCPFAKIVEAVNPERSASDNPLFNVALLYQSYPAIQVQGQHWSADDANFDAEIGLIDLRFIAFETNAGLQIDCEFRSAVFEIATIDKLLAAYTDVLMQVVATPAMLVTEIALPHDLAARAAAHAQQRHRQTLAIAANFTVDPITEPLAFWMDELRIPTQIELAPFDQIFQQLLDPTSLLARNTDGANLLFVQWREGHAPGAQARELATALSSAASRGGAPILVCICPPEASAEEAILAAELAGQAGVHVLYPHQILSLYPIETYRDEYAEAIGAIPYTPDFFVALATAAARRLYALRSTPYKVIALDCDNTLWRGVCGEEGPVGVEVDPSHHALQQFMLAQRNAGMLLCLNSKNAEADVTAVFKQNTGMLLRPEHITASRINWKPKSDNLLDLARELNLGVDSIIFVDDNPLECAEVRANCPGALVLELPADPTKIPDALHHLWAFDHWSVTNEDRQRSELYRQQQQRDQARATTGDLEEFLSSLDLQIEIRPMQPDEIARVSQLTQRTNQFNCTSIRRSEGEINALLESGSECLIVNVRDRFGDYGLVGVAIFAVQPEALVVDTLLMSCRALGRRVEHKILAHLGHIAQARGLDRVEIAFRPTAKNRPAQDFLESLACTPHSAHFSFTVDQALSVPDARTTPVAPVGQSTSTPSKQAPRADLARIATDLADVTSIAKSIRYLAPNPVIETGSVKARTATEEILGNIWAALLHIAAPGIHDDFFRLGGNSLLAVQVISRVRQSLGVELPLRAIFEQPTLAGFSQSIESTRRIQSGTVTPPLVSTHRTDFAPASFAQQRLWFLDQLEPGSPFYNMPVAMRLTGPLDDSAIEKALAALIQRHESLRTTFQLKRELLVQVVAPEIPLPLSRVDISDLPELEREERAQKLISDDARRPFHLSTGPLFRAFLVKISPEEHIFMVNMHHAVSDGWSLTLLTRDMSALYEEFCTGVPSLLSPLPLNYGDYAVWQSDYLKGGALERQLSFWKSQLAGAPPSIELPTDRLRPPVQTYEGAKRTIDFGHELLEGLKSLSQAEGATLFITLVAAFNALLSRYSGQKDIVIGTANAGRHHPDTENIVGYFANTIVLRTDLSTEPTFSELVHRVRESTLNAFANQDIPFERLVEELNPVRDMSRSPMFQVMLILQNAFRRANTFGSIKAAPYTAAGGAAKVDLLLNVFEDHSRLQCALEYNVALYDASTVDRMLQNFGALLESAVKDPTQRVSEISLLEDQQRQQLIVDWNETKSDYPTDKSVHQLIEEQAARSPEASAVICESGTLTYRELNTQANQLANYLRSQGVQSGDRVGIYLERSIPLMVSLLAVQKCGAAYVPFDPAYPEERLRVIAEDAAIACIVTVQPLINKMPPFAGKVICVDTEAARIATEGDRNLPTPASPNAAMYVIFTSGSTGRPKGVEVPNRCVVNLLSWMAKELRMGPDDVFPALASFAFDMSIPELYLALTTGGAVLLLDSHLASNGEELAAQLRRHHATVVHATPTTWSLLLDAGFTGAGLKRCVGAELLPSELFGRLMRAAEGTPLYNLYGPTETTVWSTFHRFTSADETIVVGRPLANTQIYVLDENLQPVPVGVAGGIYIAGDGVARGYLNRPELTAEKFLRNPFAAQGKLYYTGDLGKYLPDGRLQYIERADNQVKIRGFRIELGEIEKTLASHPAVRSCAVVVREDQPGDKRLAAYVVGEIGMTMPVADLADFLMAYLPDYMIPRIYVVLDALPISPNGKIDRKALPAPEFVADTTQFIAPRTLTEQTLAEIWSDVLRVDSIGATSHFFNLGGHSLLATQAISRIRRIMDIELPLRDIFEAPTIEALARRIDATTRSAQATLIPRSSREHPLPLSFAQERLWFLDQFDPGNPRYNGPMPMRLRGPLDHSAMRDAMNAIIRRHEVLRTTFRLESDRPVQEIAPELIIDVPLIDISNLPSEVREAEARALAIDEARQPFNLRTGPVIRAALLRLDQQDHILLLDIHHIATDGWSIWPFINELGALYEAALAHQPSPLPELPIQYADFAVWQREWIESDQISAQLNYWKQQLAEAPERIDLPTDRPRLAVETYRGSTETIVFSSTLLKDLHRLGQREGVTLYMTMLAAFQTLLHRYTGQDNIVVGSPIANRTRAEIEDLIGFFVNTLVMHTDLSGDPTFLELLQRVRTVALGAFANQDLPFEKLVEAIAPDRDLGNNPLVQVLFVMQNARRSGLRIAGVEFEGMPIHNGTSKFDLGIFLVETADGLSCTAEYSTDLFDTSTIRRMLGHMGALLQAIVANPEAPIGELQILGVGERQQVLQLSSGPRAEFPRSRSLHRLVEQQAARTPEAVAVIVGNQRTTYRELNNRANQVAHFIRQHGAGPEVLVGIFCERNLDLLIGILGILKSGSAYVPLDPMYPGDRIAAILEDAAAPLVLTQQTISDQLPAFDGKKISLDGQRDEIAREPRTNLDVEVDASNLAYVLFTSGSTGRPKGVALEHGSATTFVAWAQGVFSPQELAGVLLSTSVCFDLSVFEIFVTLSSGGSIIVAENALYLPRLEARNEVTLINTVPSAIAELVREGAVPASVLTVNLAGEALRDELVEQIYATTTVERVYNLYGPTEDTTYSTYTLVPRGLPVTIGRPLMNTQAHILDPHGHILPIGVPGELFLAGEGLARGYYGRADLTAQRFVPDPFSSIPGARMYRTGDLCRWLPDGNIQYMGRADHQVKLRGFRIELGEIEAVLSSHPGVTDCVVIAREDIPGDKRLVGYLVASTEDTGPQPDNSDSLGTEQVAQWAATFDEAYRRGGDTSDATFNIAGWDSSYTGEPIPAAEMKVWVDTTVGRILSLNPTRVWEIGCGTGLLLFPIAPRTQRYFGTDVSGAAIHFLQQQIQRPELALPQVDLDRRPAHQIDGTHDRYDTVVVNSVAQYFPDLDYFLQVLTGALEAAGPNGTIFLGDLRSLPLLETFHSSVQIFRASNATASADLQRLVRKGVAQEGELLIDPEFFQAVRHRLPGIRRVEIQLKRGREHHELSRFRYDAILHLGPTPAEKVACPWIDWQAQQFTLDLLRTTLHTTQPIMLGLTRVPNARLQADVAAQSLLMQTGGPETIGEIREIVNGIVTAQPAFEPEDFWALEAEAPYRIEIHSSRPATDGCFDVILRRLTPAGEADFTEPRHPSDLASDQPLRSYTNNPLRQRIAAQLVPQLRLWLAAKLPEYMIPQALMVLDAMPLSANGKINRKALPIPDQFGIDTAGTYVAPRTPTQEMLATIFADVLRLDRVGLNDNFFELGGHSLSATQVTSRARQSFGVDLQVRAIFEASTVATLSETIERMMRGKIGLIAPPIVTVPRDQQLPLSFAQQRLWVQDQIDPNNATFNVPRALRLKGALNILALEAALNGIVARHEVLRTNYRSDRDGHPFQVIHPELLVPLRVLDLRELNPLDREKEARRLVQQEAATPFQLATDSITRNLLLHLGPDDHLLVMNTHHIVSDGWSTGIILRELGALYEAALQGKPNPLPDLPIQYADFAVWQRNWLQGEVLSQQVSYWKSRLEGAPQLLALPTDRPRPATSAYRGAMHHALLPATLTTAVRTLGRQRGASTFMVLLAAFECMILHFTRNPDIVLGTDLANRTNHQTEGLIGFFVNLLVLRTDLSGDPTFEALLGRVREVALEAYAHQDVPFDKLVEELKPERNSSYHPLVQVLFVQQNTPRSTSPLPGIETTPYPIETPSKFDMAVFINETDKGISSNWSYDPDLFDPTTIARMASLYQLVLETVTADPTMNLSSLTQTLDQADQQQRLTQHKEFQEISLQKLKSFKRRAVTIE